MHKYRQKPVREPLATTAGWLKRQNKSPARRNSVVVRLSEDEATALQTAATIAETTPAEMVRSLIRRTFYRNMFDKQKEAAT